MTPHDRRLAIMAENPDAPLPGAKHRMDSFDKLPKEVRQAIANCERYCAGMIDTAEGMHRMGKPAAKIVAKINRMAEAHITPADRHSAELFLKDLGL